jgi:hypothetical protein
MRKGLKGLLSFRNSKSPKVSASLALLLVVFMSYQNCGPTRLNGALFNQSNSPSGTIATSTTASSATIAPGPNVIPISLGSCGPDAYTNMPCVAVTICSPGTSQCQTIPNILLSTGSTGLRIFSSQVTVPLTQTKATSGNNLAECATFGTGASWGPVEKADVTLGSETAISVPVQLINFSYPGMPSSCTSNAAPMQSPNTEGFNGILGVSLFEKDCGTACSNAASTALYYSCLGSTCTQTIVPTADQLTNPVSLLSADNNGITVVLPSVPAMGASLVNGYLLLGIGTETNNTPANTVISLQTDTNGNLKFTSNGNTTNLAFVDSGSDGYYFSSLMSQALVGVNCTGPAEGYFCPPTPVTVTATLASATNASSAPVTFEVDNGSGIFNSPLALSDNLAASPGLAGAINGQVDLGLPFFFGKTIYFEISGRNSSLGTGPIIAY